MRMRNTIQRVGVNSSWADGFDDAPVKETMNVRNGTKIYPASKTSSNIRALEDVEKDLKREKQAVQGLKEAIEDYDTGWADDFEDTPVKRADLEQQLKASEQSYAQLEKELVNYPEYYAEKYKDANGIEKAVTGIVGSTVATVPVVAETTAAALKEAERKGMAADYTAALQAEEIARNKMNDYVSSFFGFYDLIDPDELSRLEQEYQRATDYRKSLEVKYEQPVDMNSWGMNLMRESAWLKNSATENLNGGWKTAADIAIDLGQGVALSPLLLAGGGAYTAGVAANAAAEDMYNQTAKGRTASEALGSGALTAGAEVISGEIMGVTNPYKPASVKQVYYALKNGNREVLKKVASGLGFEAVREDTDYLLRLVAEQMKNDPEATFDMNELRKAATRNNLGKLSDNNAEEFWKAAKVAWNAIGRN